MKAVSGIWTALKRIMGLKDEKLADTRVLAKRLMIPAIFLPIWLLLFFKLDFTNLGSYHIIHARLDDYIPFCEYFVWFYYLWFAYCILGVMSFWLQKNGEDFYRLTFNMFGGMTVFLLITILFPNQLDIRHTITDPANLSQQLVMFIQQNDTPRNVFPSLHVFNALCVTHAITNSDRLGHKRGVVINTWITCILICLSTVFIKQHSVIDVLGGCLMQAIFYFFLYGRKASAGERITSRLVRREA